MLSAIARNNHTPHTPGIINAAATAPSSSSSHVRKQSKATTMNFFSFLLVCPVMIVVRLPPCIEIERLRERERLILPPRPLCFCFFSLSFLAFLSYVCYIAFPAFIAALRPSLVHSSTCFFKSNLPQDGMGWDGMGWYGMVWR